MAIFRWVGLWTHASTLLLTCLTSVFNYRRSNSSNSVVIVMISWIILRAKIQKWLVQRSDHLFTIFSSTVINWILSKIWRKNLSQKKPKKKNEKPDPNLSTLRLSFLLWKVFSPETWSTAFNKTVSYPFFRSFQLSPNFCPAEKNLNVFFNNKVSLSCYTFHQLQKKYCLRLNEKFT